MTKKIGTIKTAAMILIIMTAVYFCLSFPQEIGQGVEKSIERCLDIIIPSMFIFMCLTTFITMSGAQSILSLPFKYISEKLFRLPGEGFAVFLLSLISGYPAGIKLVNDCAEKGYISHEQKKILCNICCCG